MKIRLGFVSNSSSSSFACSVCGETYSGWDLSLSDTDLNQCSNGHLICEDDLTEPINPDDIIDNDFEGPLIPEKYCPICSWLVSSSYDMKLFLFKEYKIPIDEAFAEVKKINKRRKKLYDSEYLLYVSQKLNLNLDTLREEIKARFVSYKEFQKYIRS